MNVTVSLSEEDFDLIMEGLEKIGRENDDLSFRYRVKIFEDDSDNDKDPEVIKGKKKQTLESVRVLQGRLIERKRILFNNDLPENERV